MIKLQALFMAILCTSLLHAQNLDDLLDEMEKSNPSPQYITNVFKSTHVINLRSVELKAPGALEFRIAHRFGSINQGTYELFGLDQASMRMSLEYGILPRFSVGIGRSTYKKTLDIYTQAALLRQQNGSRNIPLSLHYYFNTSANGLKWEFPERKNYFSSRLAYVHQFIAGSKITRTLSLQLMPTLVHLNLVPRICDQNYRTPLLGRNNYYAIGTAGRYKLTQRLALTVEYIYRLPHKNTESELYQPYYNSLSLGIDLETGGHVFQFHLSNSSPMHTQGVVMETGRKWQDGGIHFGFNITRDFTLIKNRLYENKP